LHYDNTDTHSYCYSNCNRHSNSTTTYTNSDPYAHINSDSAPTDSYANWNTYPYSYIDSYTYAYARTDYSLSTNTDDLPYQGSQHTVQFHSTSKPH